MSKEKIKEIMATVKKEKRILTDAEVQEIKTLEKDIIEKATSQQNSETKNVVSDTKPKKVVSNKKKLKIQFTKSPTGTFKLGYNVGDKVSLSSALATELIEAGYAKLTK